MFPPAIGGAANPAAGYTDGYLFGVIRNGKGLMPPYNRIEEPDRWDIVNYVRRCRARSPSRRTRRTAGRARREPSFRVPRRRDRLAARRIIIRGLERAGAVKGAATPRRNRRRTRRGSRSISREPSSSENTFGRRGSRGVES
jgi:hypothetical protein